MTGAEHWIFTWQVWIWEDAIILLDLPISDVFADRNFFWAAVYSL